MTQKSKPNKLSIKPSLYFTILFILQDPTSALLQLAEQSGMAQRFHALSLGQGQAPIATRMIKEGVREVSMTLYISYLGQIQGH
jgi:hypothetical protein